jgi:hypothetical protein
LLFVVGQFDFSVDVSVTGFIFCFGSFSMRTGSGQLPRSGFLRQSFGPVALISVSSCVFVFPASAFLEPVKFVRALVFLLSIPFLECSRRPDPAIGFRLPASFDDFSLFNGVPVSSVFRQFSCSQSAGEIRSSFSSREPARWLICTLSTTLISLGAHSGRVCLPGLAQGFFCPVAGAQSSSSARVWTALACVPSSRRALTTELGCNTLIFRRI